jgi:hypothetical protein
MEQMPNHLPWRRLELLHLTSLPQDRQFGAISSRFAKETLQTVSKLSGIPSETFVVMLNSDTTSTAQSRLQNNLAITIPLPTAIMHEFCAFKCIKLGSCVGISGVEVMSIEACVSKLCLHATATLRPLAHQVEFWKVE